MNTYFLSILSLEKIVFSGEVQSIIVPGAQGRFQVLAHHAPLLSSLQPGQLEIMAEKGEKNLYSISGGFIEVGHDQTFIFADEITLLQSSDGK